MAGHVRSDACPAAGSSGLRTSRRRVGRHPDLELFQLAEVRTSARSHHRHRALQFLTVGRARGVDPGEIEGAWSMTSGTAPGVSEDERHALPEPTPVQARLTELWTAQLQIEPIGLHDDFFELGGDSIGAAELQACIDREFGVEISATTLFLSPTVAALAEAIEEASKPTGEAR